MEHDDRSLNEPAPVFDNIEINVAEILLALGRGNDEGTRETPKRVRKFYLDWTTAGEPTFKLTDFDAESFDQMVIQRRIPFFSMCEHHLLPFFGLATVAYIPNGKILGLSKLARIVDWFSRRPQNQERLTQQIGNFISKTLKPKGVGVSLTGRHMCMEMRGIRTYGTMTTTNVLMGIIRTAPDAREEFLRSTTYEQL
ncbi:MAG: GTP cyclohydrolase I [Hyphomicrobiaceae bacterium]|nr:MAG: GTP cyclohydrolase I [Hyphomicrobiaceae bacterium]